MSSDLIFREVDEELRYEKLKALWWRYGLYLVVLSILLIVGVASYNFWQWRSKMQVEESGVRFETALKLVNNGETEKASQLFQELLDGNCEDYPALSRFVQARLDAQQGNRAAAIESYEFMAVNAGDESLRMLSLIEAVRLSFSEMSGEEIELKLAPAVMQDTSPWRHAARELLALAAYRDKDIIVAGRIFRQIATDVEVPQEIRQRVMIMLAVLAPDEIASVTKRVNE